MTITSRKMGRKRRHKITTAEFVIYSADANARNYRISEDLLWLERRCPRCAGQIQPALHGERHHSKPGVSLGNGNQKWTAPLAMRGNQWTDAGRCQRRRSRTLFD